MSDQLRDRVTAALGTAYELEAEVGRGGMGVVYRCVDRKLRRHVAIKVLPPDLAFRDEVRVRFLREAETAAQLNHQNIVPIYSVDDRDGLVWFVMALVDGESLGARLLREHRPPVADVRRILREVADALAYAHSRGIIHRDIKPDNILLDRLTGRPMVTDFGIARAAEGDSRLTVTGIAVGTPAYMSPEQATGERDIDGRSDLYSLGVVAYQMLSGELPFQATNTPSMLMKHIGEPLRPLRVLQRDVPRRLAAAVEKSLAKKPADRWRDAAEFRDAVAESEGDAPTAGDEAYRLPEHPSAAWKRPAPSDRPPRPPARRDDRLSNRGSERSGVRQRSRGRSENRDAIDAANAGWEERDTEPRRRNPDAPLPPVPPWMPLSWGDARRDWRDQRAERRYERGSSRQSIQQFEGMSREDKIRSFRKRTARSAVTIGILAGINVVFSPFFPWVLFPAMGLSIGLLHRGSSLWAEGVRLDDIFGRKAQENLRRGGPAGGALATRPLSLMDQAEKLSSREVVAGAYGDTVRRAASDQAAAHSALAKLSPADRALISDVGPTVDALAQRVGSVALALHRMDEDVTPGAVAAIDQRIAHSRAQAESPEREKKIALLERQRATIDDLLKRRDTLKVQLESASLMLQNMRLDLLALGSAGVQSAINDGSTATQEARALSRDIRNALDAAKEIR